MQQCQAIPWTGDAFRFTDMTYANLADLVTGQGSFQAGGRWNGKATFPTLYFSLAPETAWAEALSNSRRQGLPDIDLIPLTLTGCQAKVKRILDLTDPRIRRLLGVTVAQLKDEPWRTIQHQGREALTQCLGRLAREAGFQGLLVPSAARQRGINLVLFRDQVQDNELAVMHPEKLPLYRRRLRRQNPP